LLRYLSAGESHGPCLTAIIEGLPAGLPFPKEEIDRQLIRRQKGYGRGERMSIEKDEVHVLSGVRHGETIGSPLALSIRNRDWENWKETLSPFHAAFNTRAITVPRPGHADLPGGLKYHRSDLRDILERASARETAMRVAVGTVGRIMLSYFGVEVFGHVVSIGKVKAETKDLSVEEIRNLTEESPVRCADAQASREMVKAIEEAKAYGDTLGGVFEIIACGLPVGLGSHVHWDRRLDGRIAGALMSLQAIKGVEFGLGFAAARSRGSEVHDALYYTPEKGISRFTNRAGGLEGGITNGEALVVRAAMKPIPTLNRPLPSVDLQKKQEIKATVERSDVCAVPAASVVGEAIVAWELACAWKEKFGGDSILEMQEAVDRYREYIKGFLL
jgi:chorismate synthase